MSQLVKTKRQANFKDFKRFGAFDGLVEQKNVVFNSFLSFQSPFKLAHSCQKKLNLHTNLFNKLLFFLFQCHKDHFIIASFLVIIEYGVGTY
jgi:hypothetical protein